MKIASFCLLLMAIVVFVLAGCTKDMTPSSPLPENSIQKLSPPGLSKGEAPVHSATGAAHVSDFWGVEAKMMFSFSARQVGENQASGEIQFNGHDGTKFHGKLFKLQVEGNKAKLNWTFVSGPWDGMYGCAIVEDNGEGANATALDRATGILWTDGSDIGSYTIPDLIAMSPSEFVNWLETYVFTVLMGMPPGVQALLPVDHANIQVR